MRIIADLEGVSLDRKQQISASTIGGAMSVFNSAYDRMHKNYQSIKDLMVLI